MRPRALRAADHRGRAHAHHVRRYDRRATDRRARPLRRPTLRRRTFRPARHPQPRAGRVQGERGRQRGDRAGSKAIRTEFELCTVVTLVPGVGSGRGRDPSHSRLSVGQTERCALGTSRRRCAWTTCSAGSGVRNERKMSRVRRQAYKNDACDQLCARERPLSGADPGRPPSDPPPSCHPSPSAAAHALSISRARGWRVVMLTRGGERGGVRPSASRRRSRGARRGADH